MPPLLPTIVHLDADAFFVSVELALRPELRGRKVAVGGRQRGIIASASYEARAAGVYTPMPTERALRVCPDLILLPHTGNYGEASRRMFDLCESVTPLVQRNSIDEGYLDVGPCGLRTVPEIQDTIRALQQRVWRELQLPVSMGLACNRLVAQIASKLRKPRGFVTVLAGEEAAFLAPLDIGRIPGVGPKTEEALKAQGIRRVGDVLERNKDELGRIFGPDWREFAARCRGEDDRRVEPEPLDARSYSQQETFAADVPEFATIERVAKGMIDALMPKIRADGKRVRTLTVKIRYPDFRQESAGRSLAQASDLGDSFYPLVASLLRLAWTRRRPLRLVSVRFSGVEERPAQLEMFAETDEKRRRLAAVLDQLNAGPRGEPPKVRHGHQLGPEGR